MAKTTTKPKKPAKAISKAKVGGIKQTPKWKLAFLGVTVALLLAALGYAGFSTYKVHSLKAKAAGYATVYFDPGNGYKIQTCKIPTPYGYFVRVVANKPASTGLGVGMEVRIFSRPGTYELRHKESYSWWGGEITTFDTYAGAADSWYGARYVGSKQINYSHIYALAYTPQC